MTGPENNRPYPPSSQAIQDLMAAGVSATQPYLVLDTEHERDLAAIVTVPRGYDAITIDLEALRGPHRDGPDRPTGTYTVRDVGSFLTYYDKHAETQAETWVTPTEITAVLNAHHPHTGQARWEDHRVVLVLQHSVEWKRWAGVSGKLYGQEDFAEFLEDAAANVVEPDMASILEMVQTLVATTRVEFESHYRTDNGQRAFRYKETVAAKVGQKGELEVPERLQLLLRVYEGQPAILVPARFRFRLNGDQLKLGVIIDRMPEVLEAALDAVTTTIVEEIDHGSVLTGPAPGPTRR